MNSNPSYQAEALVTRLAKFNMIFRNKFIETGFTSFLNSGFVRSLIGAVCLMLFLAISGGRIDAAESTYPDLR
jgi:hypothetical protein